MIKRRHALAATALLTPSAWAQPTATSGGITMPNRPIRYIVPVAAGGGSDLVGRTVCERWARALGACAGAARGREIAGEKNGSRRV